MGTETTELTEVQTVIDGLSSPTDEQFVQAVRGYSDGAVASAAAKLALAGGGGGGDSGSALPIAEQDDSVLIDTTTYDNNVTGEGKLRTLVIPQALSSGDAPIFAVAIEGDAFPRILLLSDFTDGWYFGDGTADPYDGDSLVLSTTANGDGTYQANVGAGPAMVQLGLQDTNAGLINRSTKPLGIAGGANISSGAGVPAAGGSVGDLYIRTGGDASADTYLYVCTTEGTGGIAVWTPIVTS